MIAKRKAVLKSFVREAYAAECAEIARLRPEYRVQLLTSLICKAARFNPDKHPRDDHGRFIDAHHIAAAAKDPAKAAELRAQVTDPEQRKKLDAALKGHGEATPNEPSATPNESPKSVAGVPSGVKKPTVDQSEALARRLMRADGPTTTETVKQLQEAFGQHTKAELEQLKARLGIRAGGSQEVMARRLAERAAAYDRSNRNLYVNEKVSVEDAHAKITAMAADGTLRTPQGVTALTKMIAGGLTGDELKELKTRLGVKASGGKMEVARKLVERATKERGPTEGADVSVRTLGGETHTGRLAEVDNGTAIIEKPDGSTFATPVDGLRPPPMDDVERDAEEAAAAIAAKRASPAAEQKRQREKEKLQRMLSEAVDRNEKFDRMDADALTMPRNAWVEKHGNPRETKQYGNSHERLVRAAVKMGEHVPDEVLMDYPDLHRDVTDSRLASRTLRDHLTGKHSPDAVDKVLASPLTAKGRHDADTGSTLQGFAANDAQRHREAVKRRLAAGKPVPPEVLADYPDLAPKSSAPASAPQSADTPAVSPEDALRRIMTGQHPGYQHADITRAIGQVEDAANGGPHVQPGKAGGDALRALAANLGVPDPHKGDWRSLRTRIREHVQAGAVRAGKEKEPTS